MYPKCVLDIWFGDDEEKLYDFGNFLIAQEEKNTNDSNATLLAGENIYEQRIKNLTLRPHSSFDELMKDQFKIDDEIKNMKKAKKKGKLYGKKDLSIATYLDASRYSKKYLSKSKYRKQLKDIAKNEEREIKEARKLGFIRSKNVDDELKKIKKANKLMGEALSDVYIQKHFLN